MNSSPITNLETLLSSMEPVLNDGVYAYTLVPLGTEFDARNAVVTVQELEGLTAVVPAHVAHDAGLEVAFLASWITLNVHSGLQAVGLTAAFSRVLSDAGISCNVVAGTCHDHIFVPVEQARDALNLLRRLQASSAAADTLAA